MTIPQALIDELVDGQVVPFVGSGVSLSVKRGLFPTWPELLHSMGERLEEDARAREATLVKTFWDMDRLFDAAAEAFRGLGKAGFYALMRERFQIEKPEEVDLSLVEAIWRLKPRLVTTTNYENVLVWNGSAPTRVLNGQKPELAELSRTATPEKPKIWHLHGHIDDAGSLILAPRQYEAFYAEVENAKSDYEAALQQLKTLVTNYTLLFVGFGLSDKYVMDLLDEVLATFDGSLRPGYALLKAGETDVRQIWEKHNMQVIEFSDYGQPQLDLFDEMIQRMDTGRRSKPAGGETDRRDPIKPSVPAEYTEWLLAQCGTLELMGLELKHPSGARLNHVYTPLTTSLRSEEGRARSEPNPGSLELEREAVQLLLDSLDTQSLFVSGDPGSGKSTFCRWVAWLTSNGRMPPADVPAPDGYRETFPEQLRGRLPLCIPLRDFWEHLPRGCRCSVGSGGIEQAAQRWLAEQNPPGLDWSCLGDHLQNGSALLMFDGVDEVPTVREVDGRKWYPRRVLLAGLSSAMHSWMKAGNRVVVTSRPYGLEAQDRENLGLPHAEISGLDQPMQALLVRRWFLRLKGDSKLGKETADAMIDHLHIDRGLDDLTINPLFLTAMCIIYDEGGRLPHDKHRLYHRIVDTVLHKRYFEKEHAEVIRGRLAAIALGMHTGTGLDQQRETPEATASDHEIGCLLQAYRQVDGSTDKGLGDTVKVREDLLSQSGLLVSRGDEKAVFYHLSIQEFLAAERVFRLEYGKQDRLADLLLERGRSSGWRNTLAFLFGCLVNTINPHAGVQWLQDVVGRTQLPGEVGTDDDRWNLAIVIGDCLQILAGREAAIPDDLSRVFQRCVFEAIDREIEVEDRQTLAVALGHLGDPRISEDLRLTGHPREHPGYVEIPSGVYCFGDDKEPFRIDEPFWLSRYPVTNSQYGKFLEDGEYGNPEYWSDDGRQWLQTEGATMPKLSRDVRFNAPNQPVVGVSFWEAEAFCRWAGGCLPTEHQWEAAARGPEGRKYPWGDNWEDGICNSYEAKLRSTSAVGIFPRSRSQPFGLEDMVGNVWEWCSSDSEAPLRVLRGGCGPLHARYVRSAYRFCIEPGGRNDGIGFRCAHSSRKQAKRPEAGVRSRERRSGEVRAVGCGAAPSGARG